ncbi:MAG: hypothetical protein BWK80_57365 [Desulfobacteraceae bacterium IS3]|nr:MAG: hypothetical protein BWK80_57365 [Desulfobacteraceae bacterium IS3]
MKALTIKFEGAEKKLEVILSSPQANLRSNADNRWNRVVEASRALILSHVSTESLDAYLLSESSLFVWEDRILMITCGKTTLVKALPEILNIVGKENVAHLFYEQKDFMFPDEQPSNFKADAAFIKEYCPGKIYRFGTPCPDCVNVFYWSQANAESEPDATLEILMNDPDPSVMDIFSEKNSGTADRAESRSGLKNILQRRMLTDGYLFSPHGYSLNGVLDDNYVTVHVTPQPENAYTSFETNIIEKDYADMVNKVVSVFRPERFTVMLTKNSDGFDPMLTDSVTGYMLSGKSTESLDRRYAVNFMNYRRS